MSDSGNHDDAHGHGEAVYPYTPHHFHAAKQHFESGKMGVWLFLVTEILFFAGLFCAYTIYRGQHPEVFYWAHFYLDTFWGAVNTIILLASSLTAAWAVRNAQLGQKGLLKMNILLTIGGAFGFMGVKTIEYSHKIHDGLLPAGMFDPAHEVWETPSFKKKHPESAEAAERIIAAIAERKAQKAAVRDEIVGDSDALKLVPVIAAPKAAPAENAAPASKAADAEPAVKEEAKAPTEAKAEVAKAEADDGEEKPAKADADSAEAAAEAPAEDAPAAEEKAEPAAATKKSEPVLADDVWLESQLRALTKEERRPLEMAGVIRKPADGPIEFARPAKAGVFFSIYFFMTGLHGLHVLIGIGLWVWMLAIVSRRKVGDKYFGPIDFTALYWHLVDLIWIYLFPMLYLIH